MTASDDSAGKTPAPIRLVSGFMTVGVWTMLSRVLGFVRDILIAATLGAGPVAEAFLIAFALPNTFRRFFAEGAFNMAFVPMFSKKLEGGEDATDFARDAFSGLAAMLIAITLIALVAMPWLVFAMASGFAGDARFDLAVDYGRIAFPYVLFISLAALLSGLLNATGRFAAAAGAPVLLNLLFIGALVVADRAGFHPGETLIWAVPLAGIAQLALVWFGAARAGYSLHLRRPRLTPDMRRLMRIGAPAALAGGVVQINLLIGRQVASYFEGAVAWLSYADRLYQLPLGVVGIAVGIVLLPELSRRLRSQDSLGGRHAFNRACEFSLALTVPAAVALVVIPVPIVSVLFQRGAFDASDAAATALAVAIYGVGLPAFVLQKALQPLFFAREDTRRPFHYALVALGVNAVIAIGLAPVLGFAAAALATTVAGWGMIFTLWRGSRRMGDAVRLDDRFRARAWRILAASAAMGVVLWGLATVLAPMLAAPGLRYAALALLVGTGMASYFAAGVAFGAFRPAEFRSAFRR